MISFFVTSNGFFSDVGKVWGSISVMRRNSLYGFRKRETFHVMMGRI